MSFWRRERKQHVSPDEPRPRCAVARVLSADLVREDDVLAALRSAIGGPDEGESLSAVLAAHDVAGARLRAEAAVALARAGRDDDALVLVGESRDPDMLLLAADLYANRGELTRAIALVERALGRDIDAVGALERHAALARRLDRTPRVTPDHAATLVARTSAPTGLTIVGEAGRGGAGTVYEALDAFGRRVAFKVYHRPEQDRAKLEREAARAVELAGRGIVRVIDADAERGFIIMEWARGGSLRAAGRSATRATPDVWFPELVRAVARIHDAGLVHADLKPANVLIRTPREPIVSDFGCSCAPGDATSGGTLGYLSPERSQGVAMSMADDVYALGRILEDALAEDGDRAWQAAAEAALAPREDRPPTASALVALLPRDRPLA